MKRFPRHEKRLSRTRYLLVIAVALPVPLVPAGVALGQAEELGGKIRRGGEVVVADDEIVPHDLYLSGGNISIQGRVEGDVVAAGGDIDISGVVTGDVMAASRSLSISGQVEGDLRVATGRLRVSGTVGEDVVVAAGEMTLPGRIGEDLAFYSGRTSLDGTVSGSVLGAAGEYSRRGTVAGTEQVTIREREEDPPTAMDRLVGGVRRYLGILLVGALFLLVAPRPMHDAAATVRRRPLPSLGWGILGIAGFIALILATILATVVVSLPLGFLGLGGLVGATVLAGVLFGLLTILGFVLLVAFVAHAVVGLSTGGPIVRAGAGPLRTRGLAALAIGLVLIVVLISVPRVGALIGLLVALAGLGGLILGARVRPAAPEVPPPAEVPPPSEPS